MAPHRRAGLKPRGEFWQVDRVMAFRWLPAEARPSQAASLAGALGVSPLLAQCLLNRRLTEAGIAAAFLKPRLKDLADPFLLPDMKLAVDRLFQARAAEERVVIFGDYDVDGVTSTALLLEVLERLGWLVEAYLPNRLDEGYGLSAEAVENCLRKYPSRLILAVDCGSTAVETIAALRAQAVDVLVLDHHQAPQPARPLALVNPHCHPLEGPCVDFRNFCSVGLAFKLAHALVKRGRELGLEPALACDLRDLLDLVSLGTIADLVPLTGENRTLVAAGLQRLELSTRPGLRALKEVARCPGPLGVFEVGFQLGPRLNAAGRLETAEDALHLLRAQSESEARRLAQVLDTQNAERQRIERSIAEAAIQRVRQKFNPAEDYVIVEGQSDWHIGVVGVVASRVLNQFYRPTIIVGGDGGEWRGSGRSIAGFDLAAALGECQDLLVRAGGHAMAAGVSLQSDRLDALRTRLNTLARRQLTPALLRPELRLDGDIRLDTLTVEAVRELAMLKPTGQGNPAPAFFCSNLQLRGVPQTMGQEKQHLKLRVYDGATTREAVWWGGAAKPRPEGRFDLAFIPQENHYNGSVTIQLKVLDWRPAGASSGA